MGRSCGAKDYKNRTSYFKKKRIFKVVPSPTDHRGHMGKVLHGCTTAFLLLYNSIESCIKILSDMVRTKWQLSPASLHRTLKVQQIIALLWNQSNRVENEVRGVLQRRGSTGLTVSITVSSFLSKSGVASTHIKRGVRQWRVRLRACVCE